ncbi:DUF2244 domain-containing protein [Hirschia baltica]|uniref:Integral membrane protein-like protein n=1 Tax=Hirschia baltica (strain ATCC 49814 / DSM 5838 / IFAM 1418) TaxID=582402 RepID=C6XII0_HIRBI|nr:DUF2244 domain-containing protein [Hirschia baltica]ACT60787.1 conserved hypothetical protein [Hirschia baltica ATCC 49814]
MQDTPSKIYMDAVLQPSRSLSDRGFVTLILILTGLSILTSLAFLPYGFFIIMGFLAIDLLILWLVFRANNKALSQKTFVQVNSEDLTVIHINPQGKKSSATLPTAFTRVGLTPHGHENKFIRLSSSGHSYAIGRFLTPEERLSFVASLQDALQNARAERYI